MFKLRSSSTHFLKQIAALLCCCDNRANICPVKQKFNN